MRTLILILTLSAATTSFSAAHKSAVSDKTVDPVVTGVAVSKEHLAAWEERRKAARACPECATSQPFPEDVIVKSSIQRN